MAWEDSDQSQEVEDPGSDMKETSRKKQIEHEGQWEKGGHGKSSGR